MRHAPKLEHNFTQLLTHDSSEYGAQNTPRTMLCVRTRSSVELFVIQDGPIGIIRTLATGFALVTQAQHILAPRDIGGGRIHVEDRTRLRELPDYQTLVLLGVPTKWQQGMTLPL
jgi:hypothetical protein